MGISIVGVKPEELNGQLWLNLEASAQAGDPIPLTKNHLYRIVRRGLSDPENWEHKAISKVRTLTPGEYSLFMELLAESVRELGGVIDDGSIPAAPPPPPVSDQSQPGVGKDYGDAASTKFNDMVIGNTVDNPAPVTMKFIDSSLVCSWPAYQAPGDALYRVLMSDSPYAAPAPSDFAADLGATTQTNLAWQCESEDYLNSVAVWCYPNEAGNTNVQSAPTLHAWSKLVLPVLDLHVQLADTQVNFRWRALQGEGAITKIYRFEMRAHLQQARAQGPSYLVHQIPPHAEVSSNTYQETGLQPGKTYYYVFVNVVELSSLDGSTETYISDATEQVVEISEVLEQIHLDVESTYDENGSFCRVRFPKVPGNVALYMTQRAPHADLAEESTRGTYADLEKITAAGLSMQARLANEIVDEGEYYAVERIALPPHLTSVFLTAVAESNGQHCVGPTEHVQRTGPATNLECRHHHTWQHLAFAWPEGASDVQVYTTPANEPQPDFENTDPLSTISITDHRQRGGVRMQLDTTYAHDIYVVPITHYRHRATRSVPAKTTVHELLPFVYTFKPHAVRVKLFKRHSYQLLIRNDFHRRYDFSLDECVVGIADLAPLGRRQHQNMPEYSLMTIYPDEQLQGEPFQQFAVPKLAPKQVWLVGYVPADALSGSAFANARVLYNANVDEARQVAMRRVSAENFFQ